MTTGPFPTAWPCPGCGAQVIRRPEDVGEPPCPACGKIRVGCGTCGKSFTFDEICRHIETSDCRFPRENFLLFRDGDKRVAAGRA